MVLLPISLPKGFIPHVTEGQTVTTGDILAKKERTEEIAINIPAILQIPIKKSARTLQKNPGDRIQRGEILAARKKAFGISEDVIQSQIDGTVLRFERDSGTLVLLPEGTNPDEKEVDSIVCPIDGVVELCDNDKILLRTDRDIIQAKSGIGEDVTGEVFSIIQREDPSGKVHLHVLDSSVIGKIVLGGNWDRDVLLKAIGMGVAGVVGFSIRTEDLEHIKDRHLTTPIVSLDKDAYLRLLSWNARHIFLKGESKTILLLHI